MSAYSGTEPLSIAPAPARSSSDWARVIRSVRFWVSSFTGAGGMRVRRIPSGPVPAGLLEKINACERRIGTALYSGSPMICDQGSDYSKFWRATGRARALVAVDSDGCVVGINATVGVRLRMPGGGVRRATYLSHLRVLPECRFGQALPQLIARSALAIARDGFNAFSVADSGTGFNPEQLSRAMGVPVLAPVGGVRMIRFPTSGAFGADRDRVREAAEQEVRRAYRSLTAGYIASTGGAPAMRSARTPRWLIANDGSACACMEDCDLARRWVRLDGTTVSQTNFSMFGFRDPHGAARLIRAGLHMGAELGAPMVRMIVDESAADEIIERVGVQPALNLSITVRGMSLRGFARAPWSLHPTEL